MRSLVPRFLGAAGVTVAVMAALACVSRDGPLYPADPGPPGVVFREPDDPVEGLLSRAYRRIYSDSPRDYTREACERGLRELHEAIKTRPNDPRLHWFRHLTLERMKRVAEDRAAPRRQSGWRTPCQVAPTCWGRIAAITPRPVPGRATPRRQPPRC